MAGLRRGALRHRGELPRRRRHGPAGGRIVVNLKRVFLRVLIASLLATAGLAIGFLLLADFNERTWKVIGTTALLGGFSLLGLPGAALLDQGRAVALGWANLLLAGVGLVFSLTLLWSEAESGWKPLVALVAFGGASAQASGTTARKRADDPQSVDALYVVGVAGAFLIASLISLAAWQEIEDEGFYRVLGALAVAEVLVVLLQPILRRTSKKAPAPTDPGQARFVCTLDDGREVDCTDAMSAVISELESAGGRVVRIERR